MTSSGATIAPDTLTNIQFDGSGTKVVDAGGNVNLIAGGVGSIPEPLTPGGTVNFPGPGAWNNVNGFTSAAHSLAWSIDAPASTRLSATFTTQPVNAIAKEQLAFGVSLTCIPNPPGVTFNDWAQDISGLSGAEAAFDVDVNNDGVANGLAFLLGAEDARTDAKILLPMASYLPGEIVMSFRRSDDAALTIQSAVEYSTTLEMWTPAVADRNGISITEHNDFYEPGIDRVEVRLPDTLAVDGQLFLRLRASP